MSISPDVALLYILSTGVGVVMVLGGLRTRALVRRSSRRCPSCSRLLRSQAACRCTDP